MAKDSLSEAIFELKDRERKRRPAPAARRAPNPRRGRPKAFDPFYLFAQTLLGLSVFVQIAVIIIFA